MTLDDLATMNASDRFGYRYELSPEGALSVLPPPDSEHAAIASRLMIWLALAGWSADQLLQAAGIKMRGTDGVGGRIPDLTVWARAQPRSVWLDLSDLLLAVEIISPSSAAMDEIVKVREYARFGIPRYWMIQRDTAQTVTMHVLRPDKTYEVTAKMPLAWLLQTAPADHHLGD